MVTDIHLDLLNKEIILENTQTSFTVQEIGSKTKELLQLGPNIDDDKAFTWTGFDPLAGGNRTGVVMTMVNGWTIRSEDFGSPQTVSITQGIILGEGGGEPFNPAVNVSYAKAEYTVSSILGDATVTDILRIKRFLGIGVKREITTDGSNKVKISEEDKITPSQQYSVDSETAPTVQTDDDI